MNKRGLFAGLEQGYRTIQIAGIERNPEMLSVIESIVLLNWINQSKLPMMMPGFEEMNIKPVTIVFETEFKLDAVVGDVTEWIQL